jgi:hypothetical protein
MSKQPYRRALDEQSARIEGHLMSKMPFDTGALDGFMANEPFFWGHLMSKHALVGYLMSKHKHRKHPLWGT